MESVMKEIKFIFQYVKRHRAFYISGILTLLIVDILNLYIPQLTGEITDGLQNFTITKVGILYGVGKIVLLGLFIALGRFFWRYFLFGASRQIERDLRNDMFSHMETLSIRYFNENKTGDLMSKFTNDLNAVRMSIGPAVISSFDASVMLLLVLVKMVLYVDFRLTCVALIPLSCIALGQYYYGKLANRRFLEKQEAFSDLTDQVQESISGIRVIKAFVQERKQIYSFAKMNRINQEKNLQVAKLQAVFMPLLDLLTGLSSLLTLIYGGYLALTNQISLGQFIAFNQYIGMMVWPILAAGESITFFSQGLASLKRIAAIFDEKPDIISKEGTDSKIAIEGEIEFSNLTFAYPDQPQAKILKDINLHTNKGNTLAIIGRTGSGKSSVASLLLRLFETEPGMIRIDGHNIQDIPLHTLREAIAYVPQENFLFSDTIANNLAFGVADKTREQIEQAAKDACIHENIIDFTDGYETVVGERGVTLSGGQKQRCSIARALLKDAPILILDDALSAVDTNTEEKILSNLKKNRVGKTTIIIAHRISTIQSSDQIMVLEEENMAECGTHQDLINIPNGIYRSIYEKQQLEKQLEQA